MRRKENYSYCLPKTLTPNQLIDSSEKKKGLSYLFIIMALLRCCVSDFSSCGEQGPLFTAVPRPLNTVAPLVEHRLSLVHGLSSCGT